MLRSRSLGTVTYLSSTKYFNLQYKNIITPILFQSYPRNLINKNMRSSLSYKTRGELNSCWLAVLFVWQFYRCFVALLRCNKSPMSSLPRLKKQQQKPGSEELLPKPIQAQPPQNRDAEHGAAGQLQETTCMWREEGNRRQLAACRWSFPPWFGLCSSKKSHVAFQHKPEWIMKNYAVTK